MADQFYDGGERRKKKTRRGKRAKRTKSTDEAASSVPYSQLTWEQRRDLLQQRATKSADASLTAGKSRRGREAPPRAPHVHSLPTNSPPLPPVESGDSEPQDDRDDYHARIMAIASDPFYADESDAMIGHLANVQESALAEMFGSPNSNTEDFYASRADDGHVSAADDEFTRQYQSTMFDHLDKLSPAELLAHARRQEQELESLRQQLTDARRRLGIFGGGHAAI